MKLIARITGFVRRHKVAFLVATVIYALAIAFLIFFSAGPQNEPFVYQIH